MGYETTELGEKPKIDFQPVFGKRIEKAPKIPLRDRDGNETSRTLGIEQLLRRVPVLAFTLCQQEELPCEDAALELWASEKPPERLPHDTLLQDLKRFLADAGQPNEHVWDINGAILQEDGGALYLLLDEIRSSRVIQSREKLLDLARRYDIKKIAVIFPRSWSDEAAPEGERESEIIFDRDALGEAREEEFLQELARRHGMTNFQYMRLRTLVQGAREASRGLPRPIRPQNLEDLAAQIVAEDETPEQ